MICLLGSVSLEVEDDPLAVVSGDHNRVVVGEMVLLFVVFLSQH